ncbi:kinase, partial [Chloroflexota bacterium]
HQSWQLKRSLTNKISTPYTDFLYETAIHAGATGGKLLGAGGGGFMLFFVEPKLQPKVREALGNLLYVPFRFESSGSQIIFYEPDLFYGKLK